MNTSEQQAEIAFYIKTQIKTEEIPEEQKHAKPANISQLKLVHKTTTVSLSGIALDCGAKRNKTTSSFLCKTQNKDLMLVKKKKNLKKDLVLVVAVGDQSRSVAFPLSPI